jgi:hypothetical protein
MITPPGRKNLSRRRSSGSSMRSANRKCPIHSEMMTSTWLGSSTRSPSPYTVSIFVQPFSSKMTFAVVSMRERSTA